MIIQANKYFLILLLSCACLNNAESKATKHPHQDAVGTKGNSEEEQKGIPDKEQPVVEDPTKMSEEEGNEKGGSMPFTQFLQRKQGEEKEKKQSLEEDKRTTPVFMTTNKIIIAKQEQDKAVDEEETTQGSTITAKEEQTKKIEEEQATEKSMTITEKEHSEDKKRSPKQNQENAQGYINTNIVPDKEATEEPMNITPHFENTEASSKGPKAASNSIGEESTNQTKATTNTENGETKKQSNDLKENPTHPKPTTIFLKPKEAIQSETTSANFLKTDEVTGANEKTDEDKSPTPSTDFQEETTASLSTTTRNSISRNNHTISRHHNPSLTRSDEGDEDYPKSFEHVSLEVEEHGSKIVEAAAFPKPKSGALGLTAKISISFVLACIAFCL